MVPIHVLFLLCCCYSTCCIAIESVTSTEFLKDSNSIVSSNGDFKLGFFSPSNTTKRYVGIWFDKVPTKDVFWVANRNTPLTDSSGVMKISEDGNLQVLNGKNDIIWSSNLSTISSTDTTISSKLLDSGNLVLLSYNTSTTTTSSTNGTIIWQSFDHPTDCLLPNTKLTITSSDMKHSLLPWKSPYDPSYGGYSLGADSLTHSQVMIWDDDRPHWRSGPWNGNIFLGLLYTDEARNYANTYIRQDDRDGTIDLVYTGASTLAFSHYFFRYDGTISERWWDGEKWEYVWGAPESKCDFYGYCGAFGTCNPLSNPVCKCLKGFAPKNTKAMKITGNKIKLRH